jgi:hypothetical protein
MLAALGLMLLHVGWWALDRLVPGAADVTPVVLGDTPSPRLDAVGDSVLSRLTEPARLVVAPFATVFSLRADAWSFLHAALAAGWAVVVWALLGGAIARIAVVDLAKRERVGLGASLRFAARKAVPLIGSPTVPILGMAMVAAPVAAFGLLYRLPGSAGPLAAGVLAFLPLIGGLVLTLILVTLAAAWPMMQASVAAEDDDGFDAMSRTFAYVHQRPWHYAGYVALAAAAGTVGLVFVDLFARLVVYLSAWALSFGAPASAVELLYLGTDTDGPSAAAGLAHGVWVSAVLLLARAWVFSYFWTTATTLYLLLRGDVDGTPLGKIAYQSRPGFAVAPAADPVASPVVPPPHAAEVKSFETGMAEGQ